MADDKGMMRAFVLSSLLLLGGCIEWEQTITLHADGSGTQELSVRMTRDAQEMVSRLAAVDTTNPFDPLASMEPEMVRAELEGTGLELTHHEVANDGRRGFDLTVAFDSPEELIQSPLLGSRTEWEFVRGPRPGVTRMVLYPQGKAAWEETRRRVKAMADDPSALDQVDARRWFSHKKATLEGLDVTLRFRLPGRVLGCTNNLVRDAEDPNSVSARVTANGIETPEQLLRWLAPRFLVDFRCADPRLLLEPRD